jgi:hypothetical protein
VLSISLYTFSKSILKILLSAAQCAGDVFLSWARFVGLVWYTTPPRLFFFQSRTSLFKVTNPRAYCACRKNLTAGWNLIVAPKHSLCSYHTVTISVWRFPPTYTGLPTSTSNFPVSLHHPVQCLPVGLVPGAQTAWYWQPPIRTNTVLVATTCSSTLSLPFCLQLRKGIH